MKGAVGFLVGIIGLCLFASVSVIMPTYLRTPQGLVVFLIVLGAAFVFLNILVVGFYRMLSQLHEAVLYPDDPYYYRQPGRGLFFTGYVGFVVAFMFVVLVMFLPELTRGRVSHRGSQVAIVLGWVVAWGFLGCLLGGVFVMLRDIYHKAFYRSAVDTPVRDRDDDLDISRSGPGRRRREGNERPRDWES